MSTQKMHEQPDHDDRDAVRMVLLTAAKLAGLRCDDKSNKVQIATKMLECWHPAALAMRDQITKVLHAILEFRCHLTRRLAHQNTTLLESI